MTHKKTHLSHYEAMFILPAHVSEDSRAKLVEKVAGLISQLNGKIVKQFSMGKQKLAYMIGKHREGHFLLVYFDMDPTNQKELVHNLNLNEDLVRFMIFTVKNIPTEIKFKPLIPQS